MCLIPQGAETLRPVLLNHIGNKNHIPVECTSDPSVFPTEYIHPNKKYGRLNSRCLPNPPALKQLCCTSFPPPSGPPRRSGCRTPGPGGSAPHRLSPLWSGPPPPPCASSPIVPRFGVSPVSVCPSSSSLVSRPSANPLFPSQDCCPFVAALRHF